MPESSDYASAYYESMSPTLLAQQPVDLSSEKIKPNVKWETLFSHLESRMAMLRSWRWSWWAHWSVIAAFFSPRRYVWLVTPNRMWRGSGINDQIIDSTCQLSLRTCQGGLWSGLTNPTRIWYKLEIGLPWAQIDADAREWLEDTEQRVRHTCCFCG